MSFTSKYTGSEIEEMLDFVYQNKSNDGGRILCIETSSDANGLVVIEEIEGYTYLNAVAFNLAQPTSVIRFGDNLYIGYYGGSNNPSSSSTVDLLFTAIPNVNVNVYYIKNN